MIAIVFFSFFYVSIIFNPVDLAENMRKYGGFIPGIRTGKRTSEYIDNVLTRITTVGALYLAAVTVLPEFMLTGIKSAGSTVHRSGLISIRRGADLRDHRSRRSTSTSVVPRCSSSSVWRWTSCSRSKASW